MKVSYPKLHSFRLKGQENVEVLDGVTSLDIPADRVLIGALNGRLTKVVLAGYDENGEEYFASNMADGADAGWLLDRCKLNLLMLGDK